MEAHALTSEQSTEIPSALVVPCCIIAIAIATAIPIPIPIPPHHLTSVLPVPLPFQLSVQCICICFCIVSHRIASHRIASHLISILSRRLPVSKSLSIALSPSAQSRRPRPPEFCRPTLPHLAAILCLRLWN